MALLKFKRSAVPAKIPSIADLALGELAINTYDGKVYTKKDDGTQAIVEVGGGGGVQTITSSDGSVTVTGTTDINLSVPVTAATQTVILPVRNNSGATLAKGTAVYINGALGQNPTVTKAIATGDATSAQTLGLVTANIANNAVGNVTLIGSLTNLDTSAYSDGQQLYLSPTTAGALTATKPYAPNHLVYMAVVEHAHPTLGKLFVKVQNGYEMDELHNVAAQSPANNDGLFYNTSTSLWEKKSIATALGYTPANKAGDTFTGVVSIYSSNDAQLYLNGNGTSWAGMSWADVSGSDFIWYNGSTSTFAIGGGGSFVANKKLHVHGGMTIGSGLAMSASGTNSLSVEGNVTSNVDVRAPIIYDSNDTAYYVDPNSTTNLNVIYGNDTYSRAWFRNINSNEGIYNQATGQHWYSDSGNFWNMGGGNLNGQGIRFRDTHNGTVRGYVYYDQSNNVGFLNSDGNWRARVVGGDYFLADGSSARAQIFYDSNDTAYYINGAGDSVLNTLYFRNGSIQAKFAQASNFGYSSSYRTVVLGNEYLTTISMGVDVSGNASGSFNGQGEGREVLFRNGVAFVTPNSANNGYHSAFGMIDGYAYSAGSLRAPIFYDTDNTSYYVDPNSTSVLVNLNLTGGLTTFGSITVGNGSASSDIYMADSDEGTRRIHCNSNRIGFLTQAEGWGSFCSDNGDWTTEATGYAASSFRAPIFYDSNDTGYYLDAASTSVLTTVYARKTAANNTPAIQIRGGNAGYPRLQTYGLDADASAWMGLGTDMAGGPYEHSVYFPNGAGAGRLSIGDYNGTTYNPRLWVYQGYTQINDSTRSPVFYDSNDTGYYANPNGTSVLNEIQTFGVSNIYDVSVNYEFGLFFSGGKNRDYAIYREAGAWAYPYPDLRIAFHTGIKIGAAAGYNGVRFYDNSDMVTQVMSVNNGSDALGTGNVYVNNSLQADSSLRAPIFYDSNDTSFYLNPNGTSVLNAIQPWGEVGMRRGDSDTLLRSYNTSAGQATQFYVNHNLASVEIGNARGIVYAGGSYWQIANSVRAPIFYDTDNTAYYVDPHSTTNINVLNVAGGNVVKGDSEQGRSTNSGNMNSLSDPSGFFFGLAPTGAPNSDWYNWTNCMGNSWGGTDRYGFQIAHQFWNEDQFYVRRVQSGGWNTWRRIFTEGSVDIRAPIFYDRNDTSYYVNPNSESVLNTLTLFGELNLSAGTTYVDHSGTIVFRNQGNYVNSATLTTGGDFTATGNVTAYSDARLKENVVTIKDALGLVSQMRGVTYNRKDTGKAGVGVIAQEMREIMPQVIVQDGSDEGTLSVAYGNLVGVLIEAIKELRDEVEALKNRS